MEKTMHKCAYCDKEFEKIQQKRGHEVTCKLKHAGQASGGEKEKPKRKSHEHEFEVLKPISPRHVKALNMGYTKICKCGELG